MRIQIMLTANAPQIREVGNYRSLLATEGKVNKVAQHGIALCSCHTLELRHFRFSEAVQPLG